MAKVPSKGDRKSRPLAMSFQAVVASHFIQTCVHVWLKKTFIARTLHLLLLPHLIHHICLLPDTTSCFLSAPLFVHKDPLFFWLGFKFFTVFPVFHQTMKTGFVLQRCVHLFSLLLNCGSNRRHTSSIHHRSVFCSLICLFTSFIDDFSRSEICCFPFWSEL